MFIYICYIIYIYIYVYTYIHRYRYIYIYIYVYIYVVCVYITSVLIYLSIFLTTCFLFKIHADLVQWVTQFKNIENMQSYFEIFMRYYFQALSILHTEFFCIITTFCYLICWRIFFKISVLHTSMLKRF